MPAVSYAKYGKDNIRLYKVVRDEAAGTQSVTEMTVCTLLEGDIETSFTRADNSVVVPTDTQKQTTFILAKQNPVTPPELFAGILAEHFVRTYGHIHKAHVSIVQHRWTRMTVDGAPHPHSFYRDGDDKRVVECTATEGASPDAVSVEVKSGMTGLLVLKSTGSAFHGFDTKDPFTILPEVQDRILSTEVEAWWTWNTFASLEALKSEVPKFDPAWDAARRITLETFAKESSPSVQNTMYKMSEQILDAVPEVRSVAYTLPNKHYFEINMDWHGLKNTGKDAEVYAPQTDPNGLIHCVVDRQ